MDKIGPAGLPFQPRKEDPAARRGRSASAPPKTGFLSFLGQAEAPALGDGPGSLGKVDEAAVEALLDEVHQAGQNLVQNPSPDHVVAYKRAVARFIKRVVDGSVELVETEGRMRKDMKKPKYAVLRVIDEKLDKLGTYVLQNQKDRLELLRKVDELHGLLVDLRH